MFRERSRGQGSAGLLLALAGMKSTALGGERESGLADKLRALGRKRERRELALRLVDHVRALMDKNLEDLAERLTEILRVNPEGRLSNLFIEAANRATDKTLWVLANWRIGLCDSAARGDIRAVARAGMGAIVRAAVNCAKNPKRADGGL